MARKTLALVVAGTLLSVNTCALGSGIIGLTAGHVSARATDVTDTKQVQQLPFSESADATAGDGSDVTTTAELSDNSLLFSFSQLLSGALGSEIDSEGRVDFRPTVDLHYEIAASYKTTQQLWQSTPPLMDLECALLDPATSFQMGGARSAPADFESTSGPFSGSPVGTLHAGDGCSFYFLARITDESAGGAAGAAGSERLSLSVIGDLNRDRSVGFADLLTLAQHYGENGASYWNGDLNGDGNVGFDDLLLLAQHYGQSFPSGATLVSEVPEPHAAVPTAVAIGVLAFGMKRRKSA